MASVRTSPSASERARQRRYVPGSLIVSDIAVAQIVALTLNKFPGIRAVGAGPSWLRALKKLKKGALPAGINVVFDEPRGCRIRLTLKLHFLDDAVVGEIQKAVRSQVYGMTGIPVIEVSVSVGA
jgi:uncharacterized alkaline shock family protein YloU